ncbi:MAG: hypothetical protein ACT4QE_01770 [Anaerolineales bacterium]
MKNRRGNCLVMLVGLSLTGCLACVGAGVVFSIELPRRGWDTAEACAGLAVGRARFGVWWTSPTSSAAPAVAYATPYSVCSSVPWPPGLVEAGNRTFPVPWVKQP